MSLLSIFSIDKDDKIQTLKKTIEHHKLSIENEKGNIARYKASNAPKHYQDSGKQKILYFKKLIASCQQEIKSLKNK